jgi:hypothetical protein
VVPHAKAPAFSPIFWLDLARNVGSPHPYFVMAYESAPMRRAIAEALRGGRHDLVVCDFLATSVNLPDAPGPPRLLFQHNVESEIWRRLAAAQTGALQRAYLTGQWHKARRFEAAACRRFDHVITVSAADRAFLMREFGATAVSHVPTGVDADYFRPGPPERTRPGRLVFTGAMDWLPNQEAMLHFVRDILPRIRRARPDATLTIVGRHPMPGLERVCRDIPGVKLTGRVDDTRPWMEEAAVIVVPLRVGGGTRLKIYEAMAMDKPVVSTRVGAEGPPRPTAAKSCWLTRPKSSPPPWCGCWHPRRRGVGPLRRRRVRAECPAPPPLPGHHRGGGGAPVPAAPAETVITETRTPGRSPRDPTRRPTSSWRRSAPPTAPRPPRGKRRARALGRHAFADAGALLRHHDALLPARLPGRRGTPDCGGGAAGGVRRTRGRAAAPAKAGRAAWRARTSTSRFSVHGVWLARHWPEALTVDWSEPIATAALEKLLPQLLPYAESLTVDQLFTARDWLNELKGPADRRHVPDPRSRCRSAISVARRPTTLNPWLVLKGGRRRRAARGRATPNLG